MTSCPSKLRGDLSKWLCEINTGVYVGQVSARVREALWDRICTNIEDGQATMVYSFANEQHFEFRTHNTSWKVRDLDGIKLMMRPKLMQDEVSEAELPVGFSKASRRRAANRRKGTSANSEREWAFLDIETTGLHADSDIIIEIAVLVANEMEIKSTWSALIKTEVTIPVTITELTGINDEMVCNGDMEVECALRRLAEIIKDKPIVCYNKKFDIIFLENAYREAGIACPIGKVIDVLSLARKRVIDIQNYRLETLAEHFKILCERRHRALADCEILYKVFLKLNEI